ncbi:A-type inclusion protein [Hypsugopox virus]|nr:A-type inclusion protein [Hypsugopox virus]
MIKNKCEHYMDEFIKEVQTLWSKKLTTDSGLSRKTRNSIRFLFRAVTKSEYRSCYEVFTKKHVFSDSVISLYKSMYGNGTNIDKRVDTEGKYILFVVVTYLAILVDDKEMVTILSKFVNVISDIHGYYKCKYMFIGIPAVILFNKLESKDIRKLYSLFTSKFSSHIELYEEYFNFLLTSTTYYDKKKFVKFSYGPVSFSSSISVPDFVMEGLTFRSCDRLEKSKNVKDAYVFISVGSKPNVFTFSKLTKDVYPSGLIVETDDLDDSTALVMFDAPSTFDKFRNRSLLLTPEIVQTRKTVEQNVEPDYKYLTDENISKIDTSVDEDEYENVDVLLLGSSIGIVDYRLVINKLTEWLNQCEEKCNGSSDSNTVKDLREKITSLEKQLQDAMSNKSNCDFEIAKINDLESKLASETQRVTRLLDDLQKAREGICDSDSFNDKTIIDELRKEIQKERTIRDELTKELDKVRNGDGTSSYERELQLTRQWLHDRDDELREMSRKAKHLERELERERIKNRQIDVYKRELDDAKSKIITLEHDLNNCISSSNNDANLLIEIDSLKQHITRLEKQLASCEASNGSESSCDTIVTSLKERIAYLESELEKYVKSEGNANFTLLNEINRLRDKNAELQQQLKHAQSQDKNDSYYKRALESERAKIIELENELRHCFDNNNSAEYITKINQMEKIIKSLEFEIKSLELELKLCKDTDQDSIKIYQDKITELQRELEKCKQGGGGSNHSEIKVFYDEECRQESFRLQKRVNELNDELDRLRKEDKTDTYYKRELDRQRKKVVELEQELEKYFNDDKVIRYKKEVDSMQVIINDMKQKLEKCKRGGGSNSNFCVVDCSFEQKKIEMLELELKGAKDTIRQLEKFIEFSTQRHELTERLEREKIAKMELEHALERERAKKDCGGVKCEQELELERTKNKRLELSLDAEKDKVNFYKRELERERFVTSDIQ